MRKIFLFILIVFGVAASAQTNIYDTATLRLRINTDVVPNGGTYQLTPQKLNKIFNGFLNTWPQTTSGGSLSGSTTFNGHNLYNFILDSMQAVQINTSKLQFNLGGDATGDMFYRNALGIVTRLPIGTPGQALMVSGGIPTWTNLLDSNGNYLVYTDAMARNAIKTVLSSEFTYTDSIRIASISPSKILQNSTNRFVTDLQIAYWNAKLNASDTLNKWQPKGNYVTQTQLDALSSSGLGLPIFTNGLTYSAVTNQVSALTNSAIWNANRIVNYLVDFSPLPGHFLMFDTSGGVAHYSWQKPDSVTQAYFDASMYALQAALIDTAANLRSLLPQYFWPVYPLVGSSSGAVNTMDSVKLDPTWLQGVNNAVDFFNNYSTAGFVTNSDFLNFQSQVSDSLDLLKLASFVVTGSTDKVATITTQSGATYDAPFIDLTTVDTTTTTNAGKYINDQFGTVQTPANFNISGQGAMGNLWVKGSVSGAANTTTNGSLFNNVYTATGDNALFNAIRLTSNGAVNKNGHSGVYLMGLNSDLPIYTHLITQAADVPVFANGVPSAAIAGTQQMNGTITTQNYNYGVNGGLSFASNPSVLSYNNFAVGGGLSYTNASHTVSTDYIDAAVGGVVNMFGTSNVSDVAGLYSRLFINTTSSITNYSGLLIRNPANAGQPLGTIVNHYALNIEDSTGINYFASLNDHTGVAKLVTVTNGRIGVGGSSGSTSLTLTTTGTSGAATLVGSTLNIPQYSGGTAYAQYTVTSGTSSTVASDADMFVINPSSVMASYTATLPASPTSGQTVSFVFGGNITSGTVVTSFTAAANSGQSLRQATTPTSVQAGEAIVYKYFSGNTTWYRIK